MFDALLKQIESISTGPGVYRMLDCDDQVIYIGKAKNLRKRVSSYFRDAVTDPKTLALRTHITNIDTILARSESEALLLENTLIKRYKPEYNILLKDDKGYSYLQLSNHAFPRISYARKRNLKHGESFGPYTDAGAAKQSLDVLVQTFGVRTCRDTEYSNRSRPCLQHEIGRCSAPCVGLIDEAAYATEIGKARQLLSGKSQALIAELKASMDVASENQDYELAAKLRDQYRALLEIQKPQHVVGGKGHYDVIALVVESGWAMAGVLSVRSGELVQQHQYRFPSHDAPKSRLMDEMLAAYMFEEKADDKANILLVNYLPEQPKASAKLFSEAVEKQIEIARAQRGERARWMEMALSNVTGALQRFLQTQSSAMQATVELKQLLKLSKIPKRMECIDISHTQGAQTIASCVVFGPHGPVKQQYRRYKLDLETGDDYAAMRALAGRRYAKGRPVPDILLIDGGRAQLNVVLEILAQQERRIPCVLAISKGRTRRLGFEELHVADWTEPPEIDPHSLGFRLLQHMRDESHRFAIKAHRGARAKAGMRSVLADVPGLGKQRILDLMRQFEGLRGLTGAGVEEIAQTPGISKKLAEEIYKHLHA